MNSWPGIGALIVGMHAQGYDVEMKQLAEPWRANFYPAGIAHSIVKGTAWDVSRGAPCSARRGRIHHDAITVSVVASSF